MSMPIIALMKRSAERWSTRLTRITQNIPEIRVATRLSQDSNDLQITPDAGVICHFKPTVKSNAATFVSQVEVP